MSDLFEYTRAAKEEARQKLSNSKRARNAYVTFDEVTITSWVDAIDLLSGSQHRSLLRAIHGLGLNLLNVVAVLAWARAESTRRRETVRRARKARDAHNAARARGLASDRYDLALAWRLEQNRLVGSAGRRVDTAAYVAHAELYEELLRTTGKPPDETADSIILGLMRAFGMNVADTAALRRQRRRIVERYGRRFPALRKAVVSKRRT
jgi:hypothetical protein